MKEKKLAITIVVPSYNEAKNFRNGRLNSLFVFLKEQEFSYEIIFVNDGSTDNTLQLLQKLATTKPNVRILNIPHGGKAAAVKAGVMAARGDVVLFTDFDQSTPIFEVTKVLDSFKKGADAVIARRKHVQDWPLPQRLRSKVFNLLAQGIILPGVSDTQCGFKAFRTSLARKLFSNLRVTKSVQQGRYMGAFDVELLFLAKKYNYVIKTIDIHWYCVRAGSLAFTEPIRMLADVITIRIYDTIGRYNTTL